jgi:D-alanyl-D-alanine carboxypeptidase
MNKNKRVIALILIIIALLVALYVLFFGLPWGAKGDASSGPQPDQAGENSGADQEGTRSEALLYFDETGISSLWYFDPINALRYMDLSRQLPDTLMEDIVWMVEANLDLEPYEDVIYASEPDSLLVLVNKFFRLEEDYSPSDLAEIDSTMLRSEAADAMHEMINAAALEGHRLWVQSGYRSFTVQSTLYDQYSTSDGIDSADTYSARPGHSEHQTGLAVDFNTITDAFGEMPEGRWAAENSWTFGYILRYTKENSDVTLYRPEPWHFRYIGREAASHFHQSKFLSFEEYWVKYVKHMPPSAGTVIDPESESE